MTNKPTIGIIGINGTLMQSFVNARLGEPGEFGEYSSYDERTAEATAFSQFYRESSCLILAFQKDLNPKIKASLEQRARNYWGTPDSYNTLKKISWALAEQKKEQADFFRRLDLNTLEQELGQDLEFNFFKEVVSCKAEGYFPQGYRMIDYFPGNAPLAIRYAQKIKEEVKTQKPKPVIVVSNEPIALSNLISIVCPQMTEYIIALTGFEKNRFEGRFNEQFTVPGVERLKISMIGDHDGYPIPVPYDLEQLHDPKIRAQLETISCPAWQDWRTFLVNYLRHVDATTTQQETIQTLNYLLEGLEESGGDVLATVGNYTNGYFHPIFPEERGLFFVGDHTLRNGKPLARPQSKLVKLVEMEQEKASRAHHAFLEKCFNNKTIRQVLPHDY